PGVRPAPIRAPPSAVPGPAGWRGPWSSRRPASASAVSRTLRLSLRHGNPRGPIRPAEAPHALNEIGRPRALRHPARHEGEAQLRDLLPTPARLEHLLQRVARRLALLREGEGVAQGDPRAM